jgi:peptide deformylase
MLFCCCFQRLRAFETNDPSISRRNVLSWSATASFAASSTMGLLLLNSEQSAASNAGNGQLNFRYSNDWTGTSLPLITLQDAAKMDAWNMARWPDPVLRRPADAVDPSYFDTVTLQSACRLLQTTARRERAVGLAAQQCGINARIVFLAGDVSGITSTPLILINPRIVQRSPELEMKVWNEHCLVLPPTFAATVLRDAWVDVRYRTVHGDRKQVHLSGEAARCAQHELDHDRGILLTDHVTLEDLQNDTMRRMEQKGHEERMTMAFARPTDYGH